MKPLRHQSAKASHYNKGAEFYDTLNEKNSEIINRILENILKHHGIKTVLDLTCGTGSQVFWLAKSGYHVTGSDINAPMLKIARDKAKKRKCAVQFFKGDMRTATIGKFDAVITIFNAIGHLTKLDFEKTLQNVRNNLHDSGLYIFDIFNLSFLIKNNNITTLTIDWHRTVGKTKIREIQYSTIDKDGILTSYTTSYTYGNTGKPRITKSTQTLQIYTAKQLQELLHKNGFKVLSQSNIDGSQFSSTKSDRMLIVAKKQSSTEIEKIAERLMNKYENVFKKLAK